MNLQIQHGYSPSIYSTGDTSQTFVPLRTEIRFAYAGRHNIPRATLPIITETQSSDTGISAAAILDLVTVNQIWGRSAVEAVTLLPLGLFNSALFTVAGEDDVRDVPGGVKS